MNDEQKRQERYEAEKRARDYRQRNKRCALCGKQDEKTLAGEYCCAECAAKHLKTQKGYYQRHKEYVNRRQKALRAERRAAGLCTRCGGRKEADKFKLCAKCRADAREDNNYYRRIRREKERRT